MASLCGHEENLPKIVPFGKGRSLGTQKDSVRDRGAGRGDVKPLCYRDTGSIRHVSLETGMDRRKQYELNFLDSAGPIWNQTAMASKRLSYIPQGKG